jgi:predicted PurR-regulated permease PerM
VVVVVFGVVAGTVVAAIPPLAQQAREFIEQVPHYIQQVQDHSSVIGRLSARYQLWQRITDTIHTAGGSAFEKLGRAATAVFGAVSDVGVVGF